MIAIKVPDGISFGTSNVLLKISAIVNNKAPNKAEAGNSNR